MSDETLREALKNLVKPQVASVEFAEVVSTNVSIDEGKFFAKVKTTDGIEINNVLIGLGSGFVVVPSVGSKVLIQQVGFASQYFVAMVSEVENVMVMAGELGGVPKVQSLVEVLNSHKSAINELLNACKTHTHSPVPANGATPPSTGFNGIQALPDVEVSEIENENFKQ